MKKVLLLGAAAAMAAVVGAAPQHPDRIPVVKATDVAKVAHVKSSKASLGARKVAPGVTLSTVVAAGDRGVKRVNSTLGMSSVLPGVKAPVSKSAKAPSRISEGMSLEESFEGWDGEATPWYPEGWSLDSKTGKTGVEYTTWTPCGAQPTLGILPVDGETMMSVSLDVEDPTAEQDEWLVSPEVTIKENEILKFYAYIDPFFLFSLDNFDWDLFDWVGERQVTYTLKVMVKEENADWVEVWDATTQWMDVSAMDLLYSTPSELQPFTVSLSSFEGKKVQIAFQFVGKDSNTLYLDMVTVGLPQLDGIVYDDPAETLYWGFDRTASWRSLTASIAQYPVFAPITWVNQTYAEGATYQWEYCDPVTADWVTSDAEELTVSYVTDYSSENSTMNNWFYAPILHASAPGATPGSYQAPYSYFQVGGKPERYVNTGKTEPELIDFGLVPFDSNIHGFGFVAMEADFGEPSTPIFGYDSNVDDWWLNYTLGGSMEDAMEGDHVYVEAIMNMIFPGTAPMVITGANILAKGQISPEAEFKFEIIGLDENMSPMYDTPLASAVCKGENVLVAEGGVQNFLNVIFDFDKPFVVEPGSNGYLARFSGFHDPVNVEYFAPMQSIIPFTHSNVFGWIDKFIKIQGAEEYRRSLTPIFYHESEYGMCHNAFAINFSAYHPWLVSETEEVKLPSDGTPVVVDLDSYYDASDLVVEAPEGVEAVVSGRYGDCKLTVSCNSSTAFAEGDLTVSAPGVKKVFVVSEAAGIEGVATDKADGATPVAAFTVTGQPVSLENVAEGVYIVKYSDGTAAKVAVK